MKIKRDEGIWWAAININLMLNIKQSCSPYPHLHTYISLDSPTE